MLPSLCSLGLYRRCTYIYITCFIILPFNTWQFIIFLLQSITDIVWHLRGFPWHLVVLLWHLLGCPTAWHPSKWVSNSHNHLTPLIGVTLTPSFFTVRLASVLQGVDHPEHYTTMVRNKHSDCAPSCYFYYFTQLKVELYVIQTAYSSSSVL